MHSTANKFSRDISAFFDAIFKEDKLATSYIELILIVEEYESVSQKLIATKMNLAPSTITRFINKLEKMGYLSKKMDGRLARISLTKKGSDKVPLFQKKYEDAEIKLKNLLGVKYVETTTQLLAHGSSLMEQA
ncbi:MAG: MarR family transcriptional regulator [Balneolaceae bacterium]